MKAILFDAGMTLIEAKPGVGKIYAGMAARHGVPVEPLAVQRTFRELWEARRDSLHLSSSEALERQWWREFVVDIFQRTGDLDAFGGNFDAFFDELYEVFNQPEIWRVFDDVAPTLDLLETRGIRRAVLSNWDSRLPILLDRLDIARRFEFVMTSAQMGFRKPDPRIFGTALDRLGIQPCEAIYVGDLYEDDYVGAKNAGITPILIDRDNTGPSVPNKIASLVELARWLDA